MSRLRFLALWLLRLMLLALVLMELGIAAKLSNAYLRGGPQGVRSFISFYHADPSALVRLSKDHLIREVQRGYESFAAVCALLFLGTWLSLWGHRRIRASISRGTAIRSSPNET